MIKQKKSFISEGYVNMISLIIIFVAIIIILLAAFIYNKSSTDVSMDLDNLQTVKEYSQESINYGEEQTKQVICSVKDKTDIICLKQI